MAVSSSEGGSNVLQNQNGLLFLDKRYKSQYNIHHIHAFKNKLLQYYSNETEHLVLAGLDTEGGGAGGIGSGPLGPRSTGALIGAGRASAELVMLGFSGAAL